MPAIPRSALRLVGPLALLLPLLISACAPAEPEGRTVLTVQATPARLVADGAATVAVAVTGKGADGSPLNGPVMLTTNRGVWQAAGTRSLMGMFSDGAFQATLVTCDSRADGACPGTAQITAQQGAVTQVTSVVFQGMELACQDGMDDDGDGLVDCADPDCEGSLLDHDATCLDGVWTCPGGQVETLCGDGTDDDCDGAVDCADPDCNSQSCSADGSYCAEGTCVCLVTGGPGTTPGMEGAGGGDCYDEIDNDCDGLVDLDDPDCQGQACNPEGDRWQGTDCTCVPDQTVESTCSDGFDNDCDGFADCADTDCGGQACLDASLAPNDEGLLCDAQAAACLCPGDPDGTRVEWDCTEGSGDEDCDGLLDCADRTNCDGQVCGPHGRECAEGACVCPGGEVELDCMNGADDDCDGLTDCADSDCRDATCGDNGRLCNGNVCACPGGLVEVACGDGSDNDCDGLFDCGDPDCTGQVCYGCADGQCICVSEGEACVVDPGTAAVTLSSDRERVLADEEQVVTLTAFVTNRLGPMAGMEVVFQAPRGGFDEVSGADTYSVLTDQLGQAHASWRPGEIPSRNLTATATVYEGGLDLATANRPIQVIGLAGIEVADIQYEVMGVKESGYRESSVLEFKVLGTDGVITNLPVPDGLLVAMNTSENTAGGLYLTKTSDTTVGSRVTTTARAGTVATTFAVTADVVIGAMQQSVTTGSLAIIGAKATQRGFTFQCGSANVGALLNADLTNSNSTIDVPCTVSLKDRFTNPIALATSVSFAAEGGTIDTPRSTSTRNNIGTAGTAFHTFGVLPQDVPPLPEEPYWVWTDPEFEQHYVKNPRDGFVTLIAFTNGEEEFIDGNGNGVYDGGDFLYQDANGNGVWDAPEVFTDDNGNGVWDVEEALEDTNGNGVWDGGETLGDADGDCLYDPAPEPFSDFGRDGLAGTGDEGEGDGVYQRGEAFWDRNRNLVWDPGDAFLDADGNGAWTPGEQFQDLDGDGAWDGGETYVDVNMDCSWTDREPFTDNDGNGTWSPAETLLVDHNGDGRWDDGEYFHDRNSNGRWDDAEEYADVNGNGRWDAAEWLNDRNGNGVWDDGDPFTDTNLNGAWNSAEWYSDENANGSYDQGEPFSDQNANGVWDPAEPYVDANGNGQYDSPESYNDSNKNGVWDPAEPLLSDLDGDGAWDAAEYYSDDNSNGQWDGADQFVDANGNGVWDQAEPYEDLDSNDAWSPAEPFTDLNGNGIFDAPEPFVDRDGDGVFTPGEPFTDLDGNGRYTPPETFYDFGDDRLANTGDLGEGDGRFTPGEPFEDRDGDHVRDLGDVYQEVDGAPGYRRGEFFVDLSEPFVDANDDSRWQPGEFFKDVNKNGRFDGPNCRWDRNTQIWTQTRILETGGASMTGGMDPAPAGAWTSGPRAWGDGVWPEICVQNDDVLGLPVHLVDENLNYPRGATSLIVEDISSMGQWWPNDYWKISLQDGWGLEWGLATDCRGQACVCANNYCTVRSYIRDFSGGYRTTLYLSATGSGGREPFTVNVSYTGCPQTCTWEIRGSEP